jgi:hypothetical protein
VVNAPAIAVRSFIIGNMRTALVACVIALGGVSTACGPDAVIPIQLPGLEIPLAPAHVVVPTPPEPDLVVPVATTPATATSASQRPVPPRTDASTTPVKPATDDPTAATPGTPQTLQTTANAAQTEKRISQALANATRDLGRVDYKSLNANGKAQYDTAQGFIRQAEAALKVKNLSYADQLASKAATMAGLLVK